MADRLIIIYSRLGPICQDELPQDVVLSVGWEKVAAKVCPEAAGNQAFQFTYLEGSLQAQDFLPYTGEWRYTIAYNSVDIAPSQVLLPGDVTSISCKGALGNYADQRAGGEVYVETDGLGAQTLVTQHGCEYPLNASTGLVSSVFGRIGAVVAQAGDYNATQVGLGNVTDDAQLKRSANDFTTFPLKASPAIADVLLLEDSAAGFAKKRISYGAIVAVVSSVFGRVGAVVAQANDYTWAQINKTVSNIADITNRSHTDLTSIGTNTHAQIDAHIGSTANPHATTATQVGLGNVTNDAQLTRAAGDFSTFANKAVVVGADVALIEDSAAAGAKKNILLSAIQTFIDALTRAAGDFSTFANKATLVGADVFIIEDSAAAGAKKNVLASAISTFINALTRAAGDFSTFAAKAVPVAADVLLIEDSAAAGAKKSITAGNLPRSYTEVSATADASTSSAAYVVITGMTTTPAAGTYRVSFSSSFAHSNNGVLANYAIHVNGVVVAHSERNFQTAGGAENAVNTQAVVTVTGVEAVDVRYKTAANTVTAHERSLILEKLTA